MKQHKIFFLLVILLLVSLVQDVFSVKAYRNCGKESDPLKLVVIPGIFVTKWKQLLDFQMTIPYTLGPNVKLAAVMDFRVRDAWIKLLDFKTNTICKFLNEYIGNMWFDIQRACGHPPGVCPMKKGYYHAENYTVDYNKLKMQAFPKGEVRITYRFTHKENNTQILCGEFLFEKH